MPKKMTLDELLRLNPHLDADELRRLLAELENTPSPEPDRPQVSRRLVVGEDPSKDPRAVRLRYRR